MPRCNDAIKSRFYAVAEMQIFPQIVPEQTKGNWPKVRKKRVGITAHKTTNETCKRGDRGRKRYVEAGLRYSIIGENYFF